MTAEPNGPGREPTPEMMRAGHEAWNASDQNDYVRMCGEIWRAMWDAAPPAAPRFCPNGRECLRGHLMGRAEEIIASMDPPAAPPEPMFATEQAGTNVGPGDERLTGAIRAHTAASPEPAADALVRQLRLMTHERTCAARGDGATDADCDCAWDDWQAAASIIEQQARELAELREQRDNARAVTRDICEEWNEECDCEKLPMALGHGEQCKAVSIRVAKAALRERVERAEADRDALADKLRAAEAETERWSRAAINAARAGGKT